MLLTLKSQIRKLSKQDYLILRQMCYDTKNLYNKTLYEIRQHFFKTEEYLKYPEVNKLLKEHESYRKVKSDTNQQIQRCVDWAFRSFFSLLKLKKAGKYKEKVHIPGYLEKDGHYPVIILAKSFSFRNGYLQLRAFKHICDELNLPYSYKIKIPFTKTIKGQIKEVRIIPKNHARYFELAITYEHDETQTNLNLDKNNFLSIDCGLDNFATCLDLQSGRSFILDGRELKSMNRWWNKENGRLRSILDKQNPRKKGDEKLKSTKKLDWLSKWRRGQFGNYISQMVAHIIKYCAQNNIGTIIMGDWADMKRGIKMQHEVKQSFVQLPFSAFKFKLETQCQKYGLDYELQEESYTSKCSFLDGEEICKHKKYLGRRIKRGLFRDSSGQFINSDVNGAGNIGVKFLRRRGDQISDLVKLGSGLMSSPKRIRLLDFENCQVKMSDLTAPVVRLQKQTSLEKTA